MAQDDSGHDAAAGSAVEKSAPQQTAVGTAVEVSDAFVNPGMPPHRERVTDEDPKIDKQAERRVYGLFYLSIIGSVLAVAAYIAFPLDDGDVGSVRLNTALLG